MTNLDQLDMDELVDFARFCVGLCALTIEWSHSTLPPLLLGKELAASLPAWAMVAIAAVHVAILYRLVFPRQTSRRGFGSGENSFWNRRIRTERPQFDSKHFKLEKTWIYTGAGTAANLEACKQGLGVAVSATDPQTKAPLTGHLIGRQTWQALPASHPLKGVQDALSFDPSVNVNAGDKLLRAQQLAAAGGDAYQANPSEPRGTPSVTPQEALETGWDFYASVQCEDGHWAGDYGGPHFLLPGLVIACHVSGVALGDRASAMLTYILNHQQKDGGWGLHIEGPATMFGTTMNYVAARLLGLPPSHPSAVAARGFIHAHGGAVGNPHWGKFWLAVLGVYEWDGVNPVPPELWLLPTWFPFHPGKMWCHCRMVYLPMSYVYGIRGTAPLSDLTRALRSELYTTPYESINWDAQRNNCASIDLYAPHTWFMELGFWLFRAYENWAPRFIFNFFRRAGCAFALEYVHAEDLQTNYVDIGPVNKVINLLSVFFAHGREDPRFARHTARVDDYLWVAEDGMKMQGYNGSQLWDTAFAMRAFAASRLAQTLPAKAAAAEASAATTAPSRTPSSSKGAGSMPAAPSAAATASKLADKLDTMAARAYAYFDASQIKEDVPMRERFFRTISKGGWPFSTNDHGWPIADCTAEGMKGALALHDLALEGHLHLGAQSRSGSLRLADGFGRERGGLIFRERYCDAVDVILAFHNPDRDGGWATYEETRGGPWYEFLNPAEVFGDIMIDYTYTELTSSAVCGLAAFRRHWPEYRTDAVNTAIATGLQYVRDQQRDDGSWYGSWAVCFTYGAWFGVEAILAAGDPAGADREALKKSCSFLLSKQRPDGGWGESYLSCLTKQYAHAPQSNAVNTAWALLALTQAQCEDAIAVRRGIDYLLSRQTPAGDWAQEGVAGIFNRTCSITYTAYRNVFPLWALAVYVNCYRYRMDRPVMAVTAPIPPAAKAATGTGTPGFASSSATTLISGVGASSDDEDGAADSPVSFGPRSGAKTATKAATPSRSASRSRAAAAAAAAPASAASAVSTSGRKRASSRAR